jgi:hypothetical protein
MKDVYAITPYDENGYSQYRVFVKRDQILQEILDAFSDGYVSVNVEIATKEMLK